MQLVGQHHVPMMAMSVIGTALERVLEMDHRTPIRQVIGDLETCQEADDQLDICSSSGLNI